MVIGRWRWCYWCDRGSVDSDEALVTGVGMGGVDTDGVDGMVLLLTL